MSDYPMLISNKLHSFRNFSIAKIHNIQIYTLSLSSLRNLKNKSYDNDGIKFTERISL